MSLFTLAAVAALVLSSVAVTSAHSTRGQPIASLVVDPYGFYSVVQMPSWGRPHSERPLTPSHRIVRVNAERLNAPRPAQLQKALYAYLQSLHTTATEIELEFEIPGRRQNEVLRQRLRELGLGEILFFFVVYALAAWLVLWSGALVFFLCGRPSAGRTYLAWSIATFLFLLTFYDYHTRAWLAPLFSVSSVGLPVSALWLAYGFPEPPRRGRVLIRRMLVALTVLAGAAAVWLASGSIIGGDARIVRQTVDVGIPPSIAVLGLSIIARIRGSTGRDRAELVTAIWGLALTPLLIALVAVLRLLTDVDFLHLMLPFITLLFPLSIGYSMIRHNILATGAVLTPRVLLVPLVISGLIVAVLAGYGTQWALQSEAGRLLLTLAVGIVCLVAVIVLARRAAFRLFFPASLQFRPTVERLTDQFATLREDAGVRQAVQTAVAHWLPVIGARIVLPDSLSEVAHLPLDGLKRLVRGDRVWTDETPWNRHLLIPMKSLGELRGVLCVGPKRGGALYTQEDLDLLETVAGLGALALHHARTLEELEDLRSFEWKVLSSEKQQALAALSAEICHEVVSPLRFIRDILRDLDRNARITTEDIQIGKDEIGRLDRIIASLRMLDPPAPRLEPIAAAVPIERAVHLIRDLVRQKRIAVTVDLPPDLRLIAHADLAVQLFVNLLRNAAQAVGDGGALGVRSFEGQGERLVEVWDNGDGIPESVAKVLFTRRITTKAKEGGHGIGLAVAYRIAHNFGWSLTFAREANRTCFRVVIPPASLPQQPRENA